MTWRERIVAARERGEFTKEDKDLSADPSTCAVGEAWVSPFDRSYTEFSDLAGYVLVGGVHAPLGGMFQYFVENDSVDRAELCLDTIEDCVLQLKRGGLSEPQATAP